MCKQRLYTVDAVLHRDFYVVDNLGRALCGRYTTDRPSFPGQECGRYTTDRPSPGPARIDRRWLQGGVNMPGRAETNLEDDRVKS